LEAAQNLQSNLIDALASLQLKKWASNCLKLLNRLHPEDYSGDPLAFDENDSIQVLGMRWNPGKDFFFFHINHALLPKCALTSRLKGVCQTLGPLSRLGNVGEKIN